MEGTATPDFAIEPLEERESIEQRVAQSLRALIVAGQLPEGTQLVQRELAARLGVSQTPVRASLGRLQREGFVAVGSTGRAFVSRLTREGAMRKTLGRLERAAGAEDVDAYLALRWEFYGTCYRASGRRRLVGEVERLYWRSERYNRLVLSTAERFQESLGRYSAFFAHCEVNDGLAAERAAQDSLRWAVDSVAGGLPSEAEFS
jgi:DNA-binding GntR family transcriptional regulator